MDVLEDPFVHRYSLHTPRASLVLPAGAAANEHTEIWMGGAHSLKGDTLEPSGLGNSWVVDCAGDIDGSYRQATGRWLACVFPDLEGPLESSERISWVVREVVDAVVASNGATPERIYVMCQHGMNRSALVSGLILRGLGFDHHETIRLIQAARPGALANDYFRRLLLET